nr:hypothetical protein [uncultured Ruminococcus sp.]
MKINKSLDIDLNIISPQKHIRIHEGDVDSVDILIGVSVDDETVDLNGVTIKYDATINNYLAEQDADGSVVDGKISIPVTQNMTAMSGLLLIDVRMIQSDQILFTQTICATVEKAVVNGSTYIDFDKITIIQRMNALEEKMEHVEEIVENFDASKLIVSVNRPPSGAPVEVDVDSLRVGDTWIEQGDEKIVYKLVEAAYHFRPHPTAEPYHKFTWQPLNERHIISNTKPPETVTYQAVDYSVDGVAWSWFPVQDYFQSDHYAQQITADEFTYYICEDAVLNSHNTGICYYVWREEGGSGNLSTKMDLAPLNPTAEQIADMPAGQLYGDTANHEVTIKGGQSLYDKEYLDENYRKIVISNTRRPPYRVADGSYVKPGVIWCYYNTVCILQSINHDIYSGGYICSWIPIHNRTSYLSALPSASGTLEIANYAESSASGKERACPNYLTGDKISVGDTEYRVSLSINSSANRYTYTFTRIPSADDTYTKAEIDSMIPTVPTNISAFTNDSGYLTLETLPIYDGTVI